MKTSTKIAGGLVVGGLVATAVIFLVNEIRSRNTRRMLNAVSEEGYETAQDILYPEKDAWGNELRYGPVLPDPNNN